MAVKIRLKRMGKIRAPFYRVVVADSRTKRQGRAIEEIGKYHPTAEPSLIEINSERAQHWLSVGAQPTEQVLALLKVTGDWQKFKGEPGAEGTLKFAEPRPDKKALYEAALAEADGADSSSSSTTPKKSRKSAGAKESKAEESKAEESKAEENEPTEAKAEADTEEKAAEAAETSQATEGDTTGNEG